MLQDMLRHLLEYQMARQTTDDRQEARVPGLADAGAYRLLKQPAGGGPCGPDTFLSWAELLAGATRRGGQAYPIPPAPRSPWMSCSCAATNCLAPPAATASHRCRRGRRCPPAPIARPCWSMKALT